MAREGLTFDLSLEFCDLQVAFVPDTSDLPQLCVFDYLVSLTEEIVYQKSQVVSRLLTASFTSVSLDKGVDLGRN